MRGFMITDQVFRRISNLARAVRNAAYSSGNGADSNLSLKSEQFQVEPPSDVTAGVEIKGGPGMVTADRQRLAEIDRLVKERVVAAHTDDTLFQMAQKSLGTKQAGDRGVPWRELRDE
jgi:hypothetical protein